MSYFDDNEDRIIYGMRRRGPTRSPKKQAEQRAAEQRARFKPADAYLDRKALAAPPGSELARARIEAHAAFDPLWKHGGVSRFDAYNWLAIQMHLPVSACHMVLFDVAQCQRVVALCAAHPLAVEAQRAAHSINDFEDLTK